MNKKDAIVDYSYLFSNGFKMSAHVGEASNFEESQRYIYESCLIILRHLF